MITPRSSGRTGKAFIADRTSFPVKNERGIEELLIVDGAGHGKYINAFPPLRLCSSACRITGRRNMTSVKKAEIFHIFLPAPIFIYRLARLRSSGFMRSSLFSY